MTTAQLSNPQSRSEPPAPRERVRIAFMAPIVWAPWKAHFARGFELLSEELEGLVFTSSDKDLSDYRIGRFGLWAVENDGSIRSKVRRFWCQAILPLRLARKPRVQAVVAYDPYASGLAATVIARLLGVPSIIEMNGDYHETEPGGNALKRIIMRATLRWVMRNAAAVRVLNSSQEAFVRQNFPDALVFKFADFTALSVFESKESVQGNYLLSVGYPFQLKGMDVLISAFRDVVREFPDMSLRIMGYETPEELARFKAMAADIPGVAFVPAGWIDDVATQMSGAFALVNAARTEAMGRVHLEEMACGKPVIASRTNGGREYVVEGQTGLLFDVGDEAGLRDALKQLLRDRRRAHAMGVEGRKRVRELHSEQAYCANFTQMVRRVAAP